MKNAKTEIVEVNDPVRITYEFFKVVHFQLKFKQMPNGHYIGIDPGFAKFGIATIGPDKAFAVEISATQKLGDVQRLYAVNSLVPLIMQGICSAENMLVSLAVVENSAFNAHFAANLAEARAALIFGLTDFGLNPLQIQKVPPATVYKVVTGKGNLRSSELWADHLPPNAASALGCALYLPIKENYYGNHSDKRKAPAA